MSTLWGMIRLVREKTDHVQFLHLQKHVKNIKKWPIFGLSFLNFSHVLGRYKQSFLYFQKVQNKSYLEPTKFWFVLSRISLKHWQLHVEWISWTVLNRHLPPWIPLEDKFNKPNHAQIHIAETLFYELTENFLLIRCIKHEIERENYNFQP